MKLAFVARAAPLAFLCAACNHCAPGRPPRRQSAALAARADASVRPDAARDGGGEPLPPLMQDGCWSGLAQRSTPASRLSALGERCAAGMQPVFAAPRSVTLTREHASRLAFSVDDPSKCLRVAAVSSDGSARIALSLRDAAGHELAREAGRGGFALLMPKGPVCVERAGAYRVAVSARAGHASALVQVWRAK